MYNIKKINAISPVYHSILPGGEYNVAADVVNPDAIMVRSANLHEMEINDNLLCVARAGAGVNNIPLEKMAQKGVVVFNSPGANANAVKELVLAGLCMKWLKEQGGVPGIEQVNIEKAKLLYDALDESDFYRAPVVPRYRSRMNVTFTTPSPEMDAAFVKAAAGQGLVNLKGHRLVGGIRASIYNAMPIEGVRKLAAFMKQFESENK